MAHQLCYLAKKNYQTIGLNIQVEADNEKERIYDRRQRNYNLKSVLSLLDGWKLILYHLAFFAQIKHKYWLKELF